LFNIIIMQDTSKTSDTNNMNKIELYQNFANLGLCTIISLNLLYWLLYNTSLDVSVPIIFAYFLGDFYFCKPEIKLHHLLGMSILGFKMYHYGEAVDDSIIVSSLYKTEISTFFYIFKLLMETYKIKSKTLTTINNALFFMTFFKYRIYDYYVDVVANPMTYAVFHSYSGDSLLQLSIIHFGVYGLFVLNLYWFTILCKILYKPLNSMFSESTSIPLCHKIVSYFYFSNLGIAYFIYSFSPNEVYIHDIIGILTLSLGRYYYHQRVAQTYQDTNQLEYTSYSIMKPFVVDKFCIHLRSFLCLTAAFYHSSNWQIIVLSAIFHTSSFIQLIDYLYDVKQTDNIIVYHPKCEQCKGFLEATNLFISSPVVMDTLFVALFASYYISGIHLLFTTVACMLLLVVSPFYEMNHIAFHGFLALQTVYLCKCVISHNHHYSSL